MSPVEARINQFLVEVFNSILRLEESSLAKGKHNNLSVSEVHVLEAVQNAPQGQPMGEMAKALHITAGSLTTAVKTLEQKGYLLRTRTPPDKRRVTLALTPCAQEALQTHAEFHRLLVQSVCQKLDEPQLASLAQMLQDLGVFFADI